MFGVLAILLDFFRLFFNRDRLIHHSESVQCTVQRSSQIRKCGEFAQYAQLSVGAVLTRQTVIASSLNVECDNVKRWFPRCGLTAPNINYDLTCATSV